MQQREKPVIGISTDIDIPERTSVKQRYIDAVIKAGGSPLLIPFSNSLDALQNVISRLDGLVLSGGGDISPSMYEASFHPQCGDVCPERDTFDCVLLGLAQQQGIPVLGICRGMQMINVYFGGTLFQDLSSQYSSEICHRADEKGGVSWHTIRLLKAGGLYRAVEKDTIMVSSIHHQAVDKLAAGFRVTAFAVDGIIEAIESDSYKDIWGVQFHPEVQIDEHEDSLHIFRCWMDRARAYMDHYLNKIL